MNHLERLILLGVFSFFLIPFAFAQPKVIITDDDLQNQIYNWSKDTIYVLQKKVVLESDGKLTIEEGTMITAETNGGLVIQEGAQLFAEGTKDAPIIFTTEEALPGSWDILNTQKGKWRGLRMKGMPGFNSGILTYVSIRQAGQIFNVLDEAGLVLENIDKSTTIHHIEVTASGLDGIKIKGGDVNVAYAAVALAADDGFDWDDGWQGNGLYWFAYQGGSDTTNAEFNGSYAIEGKGGQEQMQKSNPQIFNATLIGSACAIDVGPGDRPGGNIYDPQGNPTGAIYLTEQTQGVIANSVFSNFPQKGIKVEDLVGNEDSQQAIAAGQLQIKNNLWWNFSNGNNTFQTDGNIICIDSMAEDPMATFLTNHLESSQNNIFGGLINASIRTCTSGNFKLDPRLTPEIENGNYPSSAYPDDSFFTELVDGSQKGAFVHELWIQDWTMLDFYGEIGKLQLGEYKINGIKYNDIDTFVISCGENISSVEFEFNIPICAGTFPGGGQGVATSRRGNKKRKTLRDPEGLDFAFYEEWALNFPGPPGSGLGCLNKPFSSKKLVVVYVDTVAPTIRLTADENHLISAFAEDCDIAEISEVTRDTLLTDTGERFVRHTFKAVDFSGNQAVKTVDESLKEPRAVWYPDFDGDGFGNSDLFIFSAVPIDGFVNKMECNDTDPSIQVQFTRDEDGNYSCPGLIGEICRVAKNLPLATPVEDFLENGTFSVFPSNLTGCGVSSFYQDRWMKIKVPVSRNISLSIKGDVSTGGPGPVGGGLPSCTNNPVTILMEIYQGDCDNLQYLECVKTGRTDLIDLNPNGFVYIRILEADNFDIGCFFIEAIELPKTVTNDICATAQELEMAAGDSCFQQTFSNVNAIASNVEGKDPCSIEEGVRDVWFSYLATNKDSLIISVDTLLNSGFKMPYFELLKGGSCGTLETLGCFENKARLGGLIAGDQLIIRMTEQADLEGDFQLNLCTKALISTSIPEVEAVVNFEVFPNPVSTDRAMQLQIKLKQSMPIAISIANSQGQLMQTILRENLGVGTFSISLPTNLLPKGIYLVQLRTEVGIKTKKIIVF